MAERKRALKQKLRDTKRLLARDELPETVRLTKERVLKSLQDELLEKQKEKRNKKIGKKYRMVKFFEKRKVTKRLMSRLRELSSCVDETERSEALAEIIELRKQLNYIVHFPPGEKYVALYPSSTTTSAKALQKRDKLLSLIAEEVENGELPDASKSFKEAKHPSFSKTPQSPIKTTEDSAESDEETSIDSVKCSSGVSGVQVPESRLTTNLQSKTADTSIQQRKKAASTKKMKRYVAPVDEEPDSESELQLHLSSKQKLKEDTFFLQDSDS